MLLDPEPAAGDTGGISDDRLRLIFTCCHPALPLEARVALTLRTLAGLKLLERLESFPALQGYYLLPATRADLLRRLGRHAEAAASYRAALGLAPSATERRYLGRRLAETRDRP